MSESTWSLLFEAHRAKKQGLRSVEQRQRARLAEMVTYARANSPYYHELYSACPQSVDDTRLLPVTSKKDLMARFDDWATDREVTIDKARAFADNRELIGERFLGKYILATTSGTTGTPGIFIMDDHAMSVTNALAFRMLSAWLSIADAIRIVVRLGRLAMVADIGSHSATTVAAARLQKSPSRRKRIQVLSVRTPLAELVTQLNAFQPVLLAPYASMAKLMSSEQQAGRLRIHPVLLALAAEGLDTPDYDRIAETFKAKVGNSYAATECTFLSHDCEHRWLHVNSDWVVFEPVDADYRPVAPGEPSHTVLLSNLANRVQPILRYDLGDSILQRPDPCPCGNPLPAIRVQGRAADVLTFSRDGERVSIPPLAFELDHIPGVERFQVVQRMPTTLRVRVQAQPGADADQVWQSIQSEIARLLAAHKLDRVAVERAEEPPEQSAGGKYRAVIPIVERGRS